MMLDQANTFNFILIMKNKTASFTILTIHNDRLKE